MRRYNDKKWEAQARAGVRELMAGDRGAMSIMFAFGTSMMLVFMSMSLDYIDYGMVQSRMQNALDVATLSAGGDLSHYTTTTGTNLTSWQADALAYYQANMPQGYMNVNMPTSSFSATVSGTAATGQTISLSASGTVSLIAPFSLTTNNGATTSTTNFNSTNVTVTNSATRITQGTVELVMVLDNTGSMSDPAVSGASATKMQGLQTAAQTAVTDLYASGNSNIYIGLVPFASTVNVASALPSGGSWLSSFSSYNTTGVTKSSWAGCPVEPRVNGSLYPQLYSPNSTGKFTPYYYNVPPSASGSFAVRSFSNNRGNGYSSVNFNNTDNNQRLICASYMKSTPYTGVPVSFSNGLTNLCGYSGTAEGNGIGYYFDTNSNVGGGQAATTLTQNTDCITHPVTFLTQNTTTLQNGIKAMTASGSTIIPVGVLWGWRMLSSAWSNTVSNAAINSTTANGGWVSSNANLPLPETTANIQRVMIVLTDGENNVGVQYLVPNDLYFNGLSGVGTNSLAAPTVVRNNAYMTNGTMESSEVTPLASNGVGDSTDINAFQLAACTAAKNDGVTIYAITFGSVSSIAQATMLACASSSNYYFNAPDNATLNSIFAQIAGNLNELRLIQ